MDFPRCSLINFLDCHRFSLIFVFEEYWSGTGVMPADRSNKFKCLREGELSKVTQVSAVQEGAINCGNNPRPSTSSTHVEQVRVLPKFLPFLLP